MTVATEVDVGIVNACLARIITQEREDAAAEEREAIYDILQEAVTRAEEKRPPKGHSPTTAAQWLRLVAGDVMRRGRPAHVQHKAAVRAAAKEMNPNE